MIIKKRNKSVELKSGKLRSKIFIVTREELHPPPIHIPDMPFNLTPILTLEDLFWQNGIYTFTLFYGE